MYAKNTADNRVENYYGPEDVDSELIIDMNYLKNREWLCQNLIIDNRRVSQLIDANREFSVAYKIIVECGKDFIFDNGEQKYILRSGKTIYEIFSDAMTANRLTQESFTHDSIHFIYQ